MDTMGFMEPYAVQDLGYDSCALCDGHAATVEEQVAVRECDLAAADCLKLSPPRISLQSALFSEAALQVEATRRNDEVLRIELQQFVAVDGYRVLALAAQHGFAIRGFYQFRSPVCH